MEVLCVAVCCSVLQCVAVCGNVLQCVAMCCSVLQCVAACCNVWQSVAVCCNASRHSALPVHLVHSAADRILLQLKRCVFVWSVGGSRYVRRNETQTVF